MRAPCAGVDCSRRSRARASARRYRQAGDATQRYRGRYPTTGPEPRISSCGDRVSLGCHGLVGLIQIIDGD